MFSRKPRYDDEVSDAQMRMVGLGFAIAIAGGIGFVLVYFYT